jgi:photosystem II stability/assembly factor-like uncharacterized protein
MTGGESKMMDRQPPSQRLAQARATETRFRRTNVEIHLTTVAAALALMLLAAGTTLAQEDIAPEPAIIAPFAPRSLLLDAAAIDGTFIVVGERGHILISSDDGASWRQSDSPSRTMLTAVYFIDRDHGWAVGHDSAILRTTDGGITWELVNWAPEDETPLFDVWFADPDNGFAIGAYGTFYVTADGGATWNLEPISDGDYHLQNVARALDGRLYIAAEAGMAYRSDDGGTTWSELPSPYEGSFFGVLPLENEAVLLFGLRGHVFRSADAGETWEAIETGTVAMLTDGIRLNDGRILIVGLGGTVLLSSDDGRSFQSHQQQNRRGISAVVEADDGTLVMVGEFGVRTMTPSDLSGPSDRAER